MPLFINGEKLVISIRDSSRAHVQPADDLDSDVASGRRRGFACGLSDRAGDRGRDQPLMRRLLRGELHPQDLVVGERDVARLASLLVRGLQRRVAIIR
jgi:hypothetical protein